MNINYEIKVLSKNWLEIDEIEKKLLQNRKVRENEYLHSKGKVNAKKIELIERKFLNTILKAKDTYNKYFETPSTWIQKFPPYITEIRLNALFTSLHENWEDEYQPTIFEQELISSNFKKFISENNNDHNKIFDRIFTPCYFSNFDLISITKINVQIQVSTNIDNINKVVIE